MVIMMQVNRFDMLSGKDVCWWGALGEDVESLLSGQPVSDLKLSGSYSDDTLEVVSTHSLLPLIV